MAKTLTDIQKQIAALQREADAIKKKEVKEVVARIKEAIEAYGLTAGDLGLGTGGATRRRPGGAKAKTTSKRAAKIKFRDAAGNSWTGHGRRPQWFLDALASGKTAEDLAA